MNAISPLIYFNVRATTVQSDGKIIVGGTASEWSSDTINRIVRLDTDGSVDATFTTGSGVNLGDVYALAIQNDGKLLIGGDFNAYNGTTRDGIARLENELVDLPSNVIESARIFIFPNPNNGIFYVQLNEELEDATITVFDVLGNKMQYVTGERVNFKQKIDLSNCEKGVYSVVITSKDKSNNGEKTQLTAVKLYFTNQ